MQSTQVDLPIFYLRHAPVSTIGDQARAIQASGAVDSVTMWDQLTFHIPPSLWTPADTPLAEALPDIDSLPDPFAGLGYVAASAPGLGLTATTDSVRRGPGELMQSMFTLADMMGGRAKIQMGAGEVKQTGPFGHKTSQGLKRMEDHFRLYRQFLEDNDPITYDGGVWKFDQAWLGYSRRFKPRLMALGGGPRLVDLATSYADGFTTLAPEVWNTPESAAGQIESMRAELERKGRDPDDFTFGVWIACLLHDDDEVIGVSLDSEPVKWMTATFGRVNPNDWDDNEGIPSPMPRDWHYANDSRPVTYGRAAAQEITAKVTPEMSRKAWFCGSPAAVAEHAQRYVDAGVSFVHLVDVLPLTRPIDEAELALGRAIDCAREIKQRNDTSRTRATTAIA
jgi:phthiodiolone/phenolphthiodiolone dimycocerosates ketoreductase